METTGRRGSGMNWEFGIDIYTLLCIIQITNENLLYRELYSMLCGDLNGRAIQKRGDICIADSLCCTAENNITLESNYTQINFF